MQIQTKGYGIYGWNGVKRYALRMKEITPEARRRHEALQFWYKHGLAAAMDAYLVSRRTLFHWQRLYKEAHGKVAALASQSRAPVRRRQRFAWDLRVIAKAHAIRAECPSLGLEKLHLLLLDWCEPRKLTYPSESTLRRLAKTDVRLRPVYPNKVRVKHTPIQGVRKPKGYSPKSAGECVGVDTIEIHGTGIYSGMRRYVVTFKDLHTRFALAAGLPSKHAKHTAKLWQIAKVCYPFKPQRVLSDNGSEFKAEFTKVVLDDGAVRWLTYPNCPKMNAHTERFNRTIQEEFIEYYLDLLFSDLNAFNDKLLDWLIWFNETRPHYALGLQSPMQFMKQQKCNMYWRDTTTCILM